MEVLCLSQELKAPENLARISSFQHLVNRNFIP